MPHNLTESTSFTLAEARKASNLCLLRGEACEGLKPSSVSGLESKVRAILALRGHISQQQIARQFGIKHRTVQAIHYGKIWKHLPERDA